VTFAPVAVAPLLASVLDAVRPEAQRAGVTIARGCSDGTLLVQGEEFLGGVDLAQAA